MIALLLFLIFAILLIHVIGRFANAVINVVSWCVVFAIKLPWRIGLFVWHTARAAQRFMRWCESRYVAAERRARDV